MKQIKRVPATDLEVGDMILIGRDQELATKVTAPVRRSKGKRGEPVLIVPNSRYGETTIPDPNMNIPIQC